MVRLISDNNADLYCFIYKVSKKKKTGAKHTYLENVAFSERRQSYSPTTGRKIKYRATKLNLTALLRSADKEATNYTLEMWTNALTGKDTWGNGVDYTHIEEMETSRSKPNLRKQYDPVILGKELHVKMPDEGTH